eukprot:1830356-Alexandrium_andersonii.AAC.1
MNVVCAFARGKLISERFPSGRLWLGPYSLSRLRRTPGVSNDVAGALPRQLAPEANAFPILLAP